MGSTSDGKQDRLHIANLDKVDSGDEMFSGGKSSSYWARKEAALEAEFLHLYKSTLGTVPTIFAILSRF